MDEMTTAQHLVELVGDKVAWNMPTTDTWSRRICINQHGTKYIFADGSAVFIAAGTAKPVVVEA